MDTKGLRKLYRESLRQTLGTVGGKTRKRPFTRMVRAVAEHRGEALTAPDEAVLVWSDLHLGHANIIEYQARPFLDVADMDEEIWQAWERVLQPESVLVLVGDVAMGDAVCEATWERIRRTPGRHKHLVIGNHDLTREGEVRAQGFDGVWSVMTSAGDPPLLWTHYPLREVPEGHVNIHGHEHGRPPRMSPHINVSIEQLEYEPIGLTRLRRLARALDRGHYPPGATTLERIAHLEQDAEPPGDPTHESPGAVGSAP